MRITIDSTSPIPIYAQLMEQIKWAVSSGTWEKGTQLPTVRQLAVELRINPNTVAHAYSELERLGVIATQRGRGTFVSTDREHPMAGEREAVLKRMIREIVAEAGRLGYTPQEVVQEILELTKQEEKSDA